MPAFTFEKISPPIDPRSVPSPVEPAVKKQRGVMVQIFSRLVETRVDRAQRVEQSITRSGRDPGVVK